MLPSYVLDSTLSLRNIGLSAGQSRHDVLSQLFHSQWELRPGLGWDHDGNRLEAELTGAVREHLSPPTLIGTFNLASKQVMPCKTADNTGAQKLLAPLTTNPVQNLLLHVHTQLLGVDSFISPR